MNIDKQNDNLAQTRLKYLNDNVKHLKQLTHNDCGLACLKMALNFVYRNLPEEIRTQKLEHLKTILEDLHIKDNSLWTIDIAHMCALTDIKHSMYTITLGVHDSYSTEDFYSKEMNFITEKNRIAAKFTNSFELGINVSKGSVDLERIKIELNKNSVCIILIDANLLNGTNIQLNSDSIEHESIDVFNLEDIEQISNARTKCCLVNPFSNVESELEKTSRTDFDKLVELNIIKSSRNNYCGHFIVLVGYDDAKKLIFYRNPASSKNFSFTSYLNFEISRKSFGTDQDILFVYN